MIASLNLRLLAAAVLLAIFCWGPDALAQEAPLRKEAVVDLNFDEVEGPAEDRATAGAVKDAAQPMNGPLRITSPFWNVRSGRAIQVDAEKMQFFQIADSADLDHDAGTTLSFFFLNLHELTDKTFRGILAKRSAANQKTNYGFNFQPSSKKLQVYVNDGSGFKVAGFPLEQAFGVRRLVHLTATFRPGDAPEPDADGDADDLEIRLFVNGKPLKPQDAIGGTVVENGCWFTDFNFAGLPNDAPLTIGASFPNGEAVSGLFDELLVFNRPLSTEEVATLFVEVAGPDAEKLAALETQAAPSATPVITNVSPRGVQIGTVNRLTITGRNLGPEATLSLPGVPAQLVQHAVIGESTAERLIANVTVSGEAAPTLVPLAVRTAQGVSMPVALPIDRLPQRMFPKPDVTEPAPLPAAYSGTLRGQDRLQLVIEGKAGQPLVAEIELKRLGGKADPVLELKNEAGRPVEIAWGRVEHGGDARLVAALPKDGRYVLELHDLAFKAARSPFRLLVGDLRIIDAVVPASTEQGADQTGRAVGPGSDGQPVQFVSSSNGPMASIAGPAVTAAQGVLPAVPVSDGREFGEKDVESTDIELATGGKQATYITGQLAGRGEVDRLRFHGRPGQELEIQVDAKAIGSPVEPVVTVREQDKVIGRQAARPGTGVVRMKVTPQAADGRFEVSIADRLRGEGHGRLYRLRIAPVGTPDLRVTVLDSSLLLPQAGRGVARLRIERSGNVTSVRLIPDEASGVAFEPAVIPLNAKSTDAFVTVTAAAGKPIGTSLSITAEAETPEGVLRRPVNMTPGGNVAVYDLRRPYYVMPLVAGAAAPTVELVRLPPAAFKGATETVGLKISGERREDYAVRFTLVTDEPARPVDPKKPAAESKPAVRLAVDAAVPAGMADAVVPLLVPADVAVGAINAVVKAEIVPHPWSSRVAAVGYSAPFKLNVLDAISSLEPTGSTALNPGENIVLIVVKRHDGFAQPVRVELRGLPEGFKAPAVELPPESSEAALNVTVPDGAAGAIANVELAVLGPNGTILKSVKPLPLEVKP